MEFRMASLDGNERKRFSDRYYEVCDKEYCDLDSDYYPWGHPWLWGPEMKLSGDSIEQIAENLYKENKENIIGSILKERATREEDQKNLSEATTPNFSLFEYTRLDRRVQILINSAIPAGKKICDEIVLIDDKTNQKFLVDLSIRKLSEREFDEKFDKYKNFI